MSLISEFRQFAMKGNVLDLAVGVIIGAAFGKIVSSFVGDIVMPPIGLLLGGVNFVDLAIVLKAAVGDEPAVLLSYGKFLQTLIDFLLVGFSVMMAVKGINSMKRKPEPAPEKAAEPIPPTTQEQLLMEIRDALKQKG
jgi:large conductance mechanosensitive channel